MQKSSDNELISHWANKAIDFAFDEPSIELIDWMTKNAQCVEIKQSDRIHIQNAYYQMGMAGSLPNVYARQAVAEKLRQLSERIPDYGFSIFDAFRTIKTQEALYLDFREQVRAENPGWNEEQIEKRALQFVSHPFDKSRFSTPLHNSGGAIDLAIYDLETGTAWDFGTEIDAITDLSYTNHFEQEFKPTPGFDEARWHLVRRNRRILYHGMCSVGFTNFPNEWWHYDLGDCLWAKIFRRDPVFDSMEDNVRAIAL